MQKQSKKKQYTLYITDILSAIKKIEEYTKRIDYEKFTKNSLIEDAVLRNLEIIGEAVKKIPSDVRKKHADIEWKKIAGLRDILIHDYSGVDLRIVWNIIETKLPELKKSIKKVK